MVEDLINYQLGDDPTDLDMSETIGGAPVIGDFVNPTTVEGPLSRVKPPGSTQDFSVT
jgi:hypothetical protein